MVRMVARDFLQKKLFYEFNVQTFNRQMQATKLQTWGLQLLLNQSFFNFLDFFLKQDLNEVQPFSIKTQELQQIDFFHNPVI